MPERDEIMRRARQAAEDRAKESSLYDVTPDWVINLRKKQAEKRTKKLLSAFDTMPHDVRVTSFWGIWERHSTGTIKTGIAALKNMSDVELYEKYVTGVNPQKSHSVEDRITLAAIAAGLVLSGTESVVTVPLSDPLHKVSSPASAEDPENTVKEVYKLLNANIKQPQFEDLTEVFGHMFRFPQPGISTPDLKILFEKKEGRKKIPQGYESIPYITMRVSQDLPLRNNRW